MYPVKDQCTAFVLWDKWDWKFFLVSWLEPLVS